MKIIENLHNRFSDAFDSYAEATRMWRSYLK